MLMKGEEISTEKTDHEEEEEAVQLGFKSLFQKANVRTISIVLFINWTLVNLGYYGVSFASGSLSDDIFVSYILISLVGELLDILQGDLTGCRTGNQRKLSNS